MLTAWPFGDLTPLRYGLILADPPWSYANWSAAGEARNPKAHYRCMSIADIGALPVHQLAGPDCWLVMWATAPMLPQAIAVLHAWGFRYVSSGAWAKRSRADAAWHMGTGYVLRSAAEFFLIGAIGRPKVRDRGIRNLLVDPVREHSRKPDSMHRLCERLSDGPRAELFGRCRRLDWETWGDEAGKFATDQVREAS